VSATATESAVVHTDDGLLLHVRAWPVSRGVARGSVLIVHGIGEHADRYAHVAARLNAAGWDVWGYDQRGHGLSQGPRGVLRHADDLLRDLARVIDMLRPVARAPFVLYGHSLGALVAARFVAEALTPSAAAWRREVDALILTSPPFDPGMSASQKALLAALGPIAPDLAVANGLDISGISRDPAVVHAYRRDPLVHDRASARLARFALDAAGAVLARAGHWRVPTLLMWAGADRVVAPRGSEAFVAAAPPSVVHARAWPGLYHEIHNEPEQAEVFVELERWLSALLSSPRRSPRSTS